MTVSPFAPDFANLPATLPIFPLTGVLLLPRGKLPLNIFEPRYLAMVDDALRGDRMIGMIQPAEGNQGAATPAVYPLGCAGRIVQFSETEDGRYLITLAGLCRFSVAEELSSTRGYRVARADWAAYADDMDGAALGDGVIDRDRLTALLRGYFDQHGLSADWDAIEQTDDERLITSLSMICPFEPREKQALLEAATAAERAQVLITLLEMSTISNGANDGTSQH